MNKRINWELLIKYLVGNLTESEKKEIQELHTSDFETKTYFKKAKKIWQASEKSLPKPDMKKAWQIVEEKIAEENQKNINHSFFENRSGFTQWWFNSKLLKVAAIFILFLVSAYFIYQSSTTNSTKIHLNELIVKNTLTEKMILPDGSQIILDSGSSFKYPQIFSGQTREVYLDGEAYFDVASDVAIPFIIHTANADIKVLGTEFNVRAWHQSEKTVVAVSEGMVAFKPINNKDPNAEVKITASQFSEMEKNRYPSLPVATDIKSHRAWKNREMYFKNVPLKEVLDQLSRWYDLEFELPDNSMTSNRVTMFLENKKINEILDVISLMNNLRYKLDGLKVSFYLDK